MLRLDGDDSRCIRNRGMATENAEAEAIVRTAVRGKGGGDQLLARRRAVSQKRALADLRTLAGAPANARKARGLEPPATPLQRPAELSRTTTQAAAPPVAPKNAVLTDDKSLNRATDTQALDEYSDGGLSYDAGTGRRVRPSLVTYDDLKDLVEAEEKRLAIGDAYTGTEWLDERGGELRPYMSGQNAESPFETWDLLLGHGGFRAVRRKLETAVSIRELVPPEVVKPEVFALEGNKVKRPVPPPPPPPPPEEKVEEKVEMKDRPPAVPRVYSAKSIQFEITTDWTGKTVEFAGTGYLQDINHVADILRNNPTVEVEIKAFVGPTRAAVLIGAELVGSTPDVYKKYGAVMDARAAKVRDMLVAQGINKARIRLSRGESGIGEAYRRVDFKFIVP